MTTRRVNEILTPVCCNSTDICAVSAEAYAKSCVANSWNFFQVEVTTGFETI